MACDACIQDILKTMYENNADLALWDAHTNRLTEVDKKKYVEIINKECEVCV